MEEDISTSPASTTSPVTLAQVSDNNSSAQKPLTPQSSSSPSVSGAAAPSLNPRSCTTCRKRKVRCDKRHPCGNCSKAGVECIFPAPGRAPRRSRKPPDTELLARLRRLEGVVQGLGKGFDEEVDVPEAEPEAEPVKPAHKNRVACDKAQKKDAFLGLHNSNSISANEPNGLVKEFGRLSVEGGRSRYVSNKFWVSLSEEVAEMRDILDDPTDDEDDYPSPGSGSAALANHQGFIFNFSSTIVTLRDFHPPAKQIATYWQIYKENVDPLIKIFHRPSTEKLLAEASQNIDHVSKPMEVMMFSIYFAVITSLSDIECITIFGVEKHATIERYRFAFEQAMARASFLSTQEIVVLQSFTLFLTCVRRLDDSRYVWTLTGLVIRIAQSLGIHRDGQQFGLSPFETEMRRRLWWQICSLDVRASEDHGSDPSIVEQTFDTRFPLNIDDTDIDPDTKETPVEKEGRTEMMFDLIRYSVSTTVRRLSYAPPGPGPCQMKSASITLEVKERLIEELHQYLEAKYLKYCDMNVPLDWVAATVSRLIMAKMWLIVHHPFQRDDGGAGLPQETKDRLFLTSVEVIEFSHLLETEKSTQKWGWLFRTYVQWHAVAFVLSQLCIRTSGPEVEKAWAAVESVFEDWGGAVSASKRGMLWKPLRKLMARARLVRARELEKQSKFPLDGSLGPSGNYASAMPCGPERMPLANGNENFSTQPYVSPSNNTFTSPFNSSVSISTSNNPFLNSSMPPPDDPGRTSHETLPMDASNDSVKWDYEDASLGLDLGLGGDEGMTWAGWDDLVKDFRMEVEDGQGVERAGVGGMINWF